jgi:hypothetical protein
MPHKFKIGQAVEYASPRWIYASPGIYVVTPKLPERDGEFEYHIKHLKELHERIISQPHMGMDTTRLGAWFAGKQRFFLGHDAGSPLEPYAGTSCRRASRCCRKPITLSRTRALKRSQPLGLLMMEAR